MPPVYLCGLKEPAARPYLNAAEGHWGSRGRGGNRTASCISTHYPLWCTSHSVRLPPDHNRISRHAKCLQQVVSHSSSLFNLHEIDRIYFKSFSCQIGAAKKSHIYVQATWVHSPSNDWYLISGNDEPPFSKCVGVTPSLVSRAQSRQIYSLASMVLSDTALFGWLFSAVLDRHEALRFVELLWPQPVRLSVWQQQVCWISRSDKWHRVRGGLRGRK